LRDLKSFFEPKSVAVVGASPDPKKLGTVIYRNIIDSGFSGKLLPVNVGGGNIYGVEAIKSVKDFPGELDLVVLVIPARFCLQTVIECAEKKVKNIIIIAAGFSEIGEEGKRLENEIKKVAEENGINILGPNCLGLVSNIVNMNATFAADTPKMGNIAFMAQSGAFLTATIDWSLKQGIGFSYIVSLGNKAGINENDLLESWKNDPNVDLIACYLEDIVDGRGFLELASGVSKIKPIVVLHPGTSEKAKKAISSHTGSLAGSSEVLAQGFRQAGIIQVFDLKQMFHTLTILSWYKKFNSDEIVIVTNAGGIGVIATDLVEKYGLKLSDISDETQKKLRGVLPAESSVSNPIDLIGDARKDRYENTLKILASDPNIQNILVILSPQLVTEIEETAECIAKASKESEKNIFACFSGGLKTEKGLEILSRNKIFGKMDPAIVLESVSLVSEYYKKRDSIQIIPSTYTKLDNSLDLLFEEVRKVGRNVLNSSEVQEILDHFGFDYPKSKSINEINEGIEFARKVGFPIVMKSGSSKILHKTEEKLIYLGISSEEELRNSFHELSLSLKSLTGSENEPILLQEQVSGIEAIIGINRDGDKNVYQNGKIGRRGFGHLMIFGTGGIYAEVYQDVASLILPASADKYIEMICKTKLSKILKGERTGKVLAIEKILETFDKLSKLVLEYPIIKEIDMNPVFITENRAIVVDMKVIID